MELGEPFIIPVSNDIELELVTLYAACIDPKLGGQLMKRLGPAAPLLGLQHAKRVRKSTNQPGKLEILLAAAPAAAEGLSMATNSHASEAAEPVTLPPVVECLVREHSLQLHTVQVSRHAPKTREQALAWGEHWPLSWRPPDPTAHPQNAELPAAEVADMKRHMQRAWELAKANAERGGVCNACLIVDSRTGCVVAEAADARQHHPLHHAIMQAVAAVADWQLATWPQAATKRADSLEHSKQHENQQLRQQDVPSSETLDSKRRRLEGACDVQLALPRLGPSQQRHASETQHVRQQARPTGTAQASRGSTADGDGMSTEPTQLLEWHPAASKAEHGASSGDACTSVGGAVAVSMTHATQPAPSAAAARCVPQGAVVPASQHPAEQAAEALGAMAAAAAGAAGATAAAGAAAAIPRGVDPGPRPYLCTGYDCYVVQEPCVMCAMALVHSRLRRVVFCLVDDKGGALGGGAAKLHAQRSLNHRYHVYRLPLVAHTSELSDGGAV